MKVSRYVHIRLLRLKNHEWSLLNFGGATVLITGDTSDPGFVRVQVAFCSKKDTFCKAVGRDEAFNAPVKVVPLRYLPREMANIAKEVESRREHGARGTDSTYEIDYDFLIRYFLPKG